MCKATSMLRTSCSWKAAVFLSPGKAYPHTRNFPDSGWQRKPTLLMCSRYSGREELTRHACISSGMWKKAVFPFEAISCCKLTIKPAREKDPSFPEFWTLGSAAGSKPTSSKHFIICVKYRNWEMFVLGLRWAWEIWIWIAALELGLECDSPYMYLRQIFWSFKKFTSVSFPTSFGGSCIFYGNPQNSGSLARLEEKSCFGSLSS